MKGGRIIGSGHLRDWKPVPEKVKRAEVFKHGDGQTAASSLDPISFSRRQLCSMNAGLHRMVSLAFVARSPWVVVGAFVVGRS
jgi:hypothetical protein